MTFQEVCAPRTLGIDIGVPPLSSISRFVHPEASSPNCEQSDDQRRGGIWLSELAMIGDLRKKHLRSQGLVDGLPVVVPQDLEELDLVILPKQAVDLLQNDELLQQVGWPHSQSRCG